MDDNDGLMFVLACHILKLSKCADSRKTGHFNLHVIVLKTTDLPRCFHMNCKDTVKIEM